jgi:N-glycosidase YbiA
VIRFYRATGRYGPFSNFSKHPIEVDGLEWPTSEHYFQAQKWPGTPHAEEVRRAETPARAAEIGRQRSRPLRPDWEDVKDDVMRLAVRAKFTQHEDLRELLLSTGDEELVEHTTNDAYWADGGDGSGQNMLGVILMEVRAELRG